MIPDTRQQLRHLDRAILALVDERARLLSSTPRGESASAVGMDDILRRYNGPLPAQEIEHLFGQIERVCAAAREEVQP
jgi:chorismate mutase